MSHLCGTLSKIRERLATQQQLSSFIKEDTMSSYNCNFCDKPFNVNDEIYEDCYFCNRYCSWEHLLEDMKHFFNVKEGEVEYK